jgi:hypothetical protein
MLTAVLLGSLGLMAASLTLSLALTPLLGTDTEPRKNGVT